MDNERIKKTVNKNDMTHFVWLYLKSYGFNFKKKDIVYLIDAVFFSLNTLIKNGLTVRIKSFGTFEVKDVDKTRTNFGEVKRKKKVIFKYNRIEKEQL